MSTEEKKLCRKCGLPLEDFPEVRDLFEEIEEEYSGTFTHELSDKVCKCEGKDK